MAKYDIVWSGVDRGHEGQWNPRVWILPLRALSEHGPFDYNDLKHPFYADVQGKAPDLGWISNNVATGEDRSLFRDNREPWAATGVIDFDGTTMALSDVGKKVVEGVVAYCDVLTTMMSEWSEHGENPFAILAEVFLAVDAYQGLKFDEVIAVMQNYRTGDDLHAALRTPIVNVSATVKRRLKALLLLMIYSGAVVFGNDTYFAGDRQRLLEILTPLHIDLCEEFRAWLTDVYRKAGGKSIGATTVNSYVNSLAYLTDADAYPGVYDHCSTSYWYNMYHYLYGKDGSPVYALETKEDVLKEFGGVYTAITEGDPPDGVDVNHFNQVRLWSQKEEVKNSSWIFYAFQRYFDFLDWRLKNKAQQEDAMWPEANRLAVALKLFERCRSEQGPSGWPSYDAWAKAARESFAKVDAGMLIAADFDYADFARKFVYNPTVANAFFKDHKEDDKREVGNFISQNRQTPKAASWYLDKGNLPAVKGLGVGCALNFMMKVRPAEFATYSPMIDKALMSVGLLSRPLPTEPTIESYEQSKALQGQVLAKMHELRIGKAADDESAADYLTVNEFAWWLSDEKNKNLIKEKVMSAQLKPVDSKKTVIKGGRALSDAFKGDEMLKRLAAALRTKPFAILAGHSGTGKSQLVRRLAYMTCNNQKLVDEGKDKTAPGNYCMVQVKPNWHDSTDLLGYYSDLGTRHFVNTAFVQFLCKAYAYPETPFFLCLDEMNLAPVEQYFAEYLSAVESVEKKGKDWVSDSLIEIVKTGEKDENGNAKVDEEIMGQIIAGAQSTEAADWIRKHGLTIPKNLFVVGTVNMDETTCQFSRKVLDRAMTLLMNEVKFADMGKTVDPSKEQLLDDAGLAFFMQGGRRGHVAATEAGLLDNLNKPLVNTPFVVAYRFANEYALYEEALANLGGLAQLDEGETDESKIAGYWKKVSEHAEEALDHVVLMKLLPRIHGMKDVVKGIFEGRKNDEKDIPGLRDEVKADGLSAGMMTEILDRGDEYLTFWP